MRFRSGLPVWNYVGFLFNMRDLPVTGRKAWAVACGIPQCASLRIQVADGCLHQLVVPGHPV